MNFWDAVYELRERELIPLVWKRADIKRHLLGTYAPSTINTVPSNASLTRDGTQAGDYIKRGSDPQAWRVGPGRFRLITDPADDLATQEEERQRAEASAQAARRMSAGDGYPLRGVRFDSIAALFDDFDYQHYGSQFPAMVGDSPVFRSDCLREFMADLLDRQPSGRFSHKQIREAAAALIVFVHENGKAHGRMEAERDTNQ